MSALIGGRARSVFFTTGVHLLTTQNVAEALRRIAERDPDDVELLALALQFRLTVWSNDQDFSIARVPWVTTAALLEQLSL